VVLNHGNGVVVVVVAVVFVFVAVVVSQLCSLLPMVSYLQWYVRKAELAARGL